MADDNTSLAGRLFNFKPKITAKLNDPSQAAATAWRRSFGSESAPIDVTTDLTLPVVVRGTWTSPLQPSHGLTHVAFAVTSTQGGSVVLNKYLDQLGQIAAGSATAAMTASVTQEISMAIYEPYIVAPDALPTAVDRRPDERQTGHRPCQGIRGD